MIIQRWQSLLLLVAAILMGIFSFVSLGQIQTTDFTFNFTALGICPEGIPTGGMVPECISTWYFFAVSILSAILAFITIFTFKQFKLQKTLSLVTMLMVACTIAVGALLGYQTVDGGSISWSSWVCAPFLSLIAVIAAYSLICSDHRKLRDSERLI